MNRLQRVMAGIVATSLVWAMPARADDGTSAEKLRRLDVMLMVTGLRCRATSDNFQADFQAFEAHHLSELNGAAGRLKAGLVSKFGMRGADRELDRISTSIANQYGNGHPWLGCHELKQVAQSLAIAEGPAPLLAAADELLSGDGPQLAYRGN